MTKIRIPDTMFGKKLGEDLIEKVLSKQSPQPTSPKTPIISSNEFWTIPNVNYNNGLYQVDLLKDLLDNGNSHTQDEWIEYSKNNDFQIADMPFYHALFKTLYNNKNNSEEIRQVLEKQFNDKWLMTSTRPIYTPKGKDKIIHNYNMPDQYEIEENLVGPDRFIERGDKKALKSLLLDDDIDNIKNIYKWITGKKTYIWRVNNKPNNQAETVARFSAGSVRAFLYCYWNPLVSDSALGVRRTKIKA